MSTTTNTAEEYTADNIQVLRDPDHIRRRPGMYIGDTGENGLHQLIVELVNNGIEEAKFGTARNIRVELLSEGGCQVDDDGEGIPVHFVERHGRHFLELALTQYRFSHRQDTYRVHGGLHGVGLKAVNALSSRLLAEVRREGKVWQQECERGKPVTPPRVIGTSDTTGTTITFWPDPQIFRPDADFSYPKIRQRLHQSACQQPGLGVHLRDHRVNPPLQWSFVSERGMVDFLAPLCIGEFPVHESVVHAKEASEGQEVEVAFRWMKTDRTIHFAGVVNGERTDRGTHRSGIRQALTQVFNRKKWRPSSLTVSGHLDSFAAQVETGLVVVVSLWLKSPQYNAATRDSLNNVEIDGIVADLTSRALTNFLRDHPDDAGAIRAHLSNPHPADAKTGV